MINKDFNITSSYEDIIKESKNNLERLNQIAVKIPSDSWIHEAIEHATLAQVHNANGSLVEFTSDNNIRWKTTVVFGTLSEFNFIMSQLDSLLENNEAILKKKINEVLAMPMMVIKEDANTGTNQGRNTLFELRLASRLAEAGYHPILSFDHPDILVQTNNNEFVIECKRLFSDKSFERLTKDAIKQLKHSSLNSDDKRLGIVAVSITRHFHAGDKKISMESPEKLGIFADREFKKFVDNNKDFIQREFPLSIPGLIIDFSDFAECDKPYWVQFIYLVGTEEDLSKSKISIPRRELDNFLNPKFT